MLSTTSSNHRPLSRDFFVVLTVIVGLSLVVSGGTIFSYIALLAASGLRNLYFPWINHGFLFYSVVALVLIIEAVVLTVAYRLARRLIP